MRSIKAVLTIALLSLTLPAFGASDYLLQLEGIPGESKKEVHKDWIEISSVQFAGGSCTLAGARVERIRHVEITASKMPAGLVQACQSQKRFASVPIEGNGQRHVLENVTLTSRPAATAGPATFRLAFSHCATHDAWPQKVEIGALKAGVAKKNGMLVGLTPTPTTVWVESLIFDESTADDAHYKKATLFVRKSGDSGVALVPSRQNVPILTLELSNGQKWTFMEVTLENVMISSATAQRSSGDRPMESLSLNFTKVTGPAAGFQAGR